MIKYWITISFIISVLTTATSMAQNGQGEREFVQFKYPNDQVSSEGFMRNGKPDGYWKTYYVTGVIKSEGKRTNFLLDSIWRFYNQAGELTQTIDYKIGKKSGYSIKYSYDNPENPGQATVVSRELYVNDRKEGNSYYYYNTGELHEIVFFKGGKKEGLSKEFSKDSVLITLMEYNNNFLVNRERINRHDNQGQKQGTFRTYYDNGQVKVEENFLDNQLHGYYREYSKNGELTTALRYERGKIVEEIDEDLKELLDMKNTYDEQGRLIFNGAYKDGVPVGIHRFYDTIGNVVNAYLYNELGNKISEGIIDPEGVKRGKWTDLYPDGKTRATGFYTDNQRTGEWTFYYHEGGIEQKGRFDRGRYQGAWTWYYPNGNLWRTEHYFNGREDGEFVEYDSHGNILTKGSYLNGEKNGEWFYQVGDNTEKGSYTIGLRDGTWKSFYNDNTLKYEGMYSQGNPDGRHKYFYPNGELKEDDYYAMGIREKTWKKYDEEGNLVMTITYRNNEEQRINGVKIRLPEGDVKLIR